MTSLQFIYPINNNILFIRTIKCNVPINIYIEKEDKNTTSNSKLFYLCAYHYFDFSLYLKQILSKYKENKENVLNEEILVLLAQGLILNIDFDTCKINTSEFNNQNIHGFKLYYDYNEYLYSQKDIKIEINNIFPHFQLTFKAPRKHKISDNIN